MRNKFRVGALKIRFSLNQPYNLNSSSKLRDVFYEQCFMSYLSYNRIIMWDSQHTHLIMRVRNLGYDSNDLIVIESNLKNWIFYNIFLKFELCFIQSTKLASKMREMYYVGSKKKTFFIWSLIQYIWLSQVNSYWIINFVLSLKSIISIN